MTSPLILRSPNLAEGGDVRVVRLYEAARPTAFKNGGLARAAPKREVLMHVTAREADQLKKRWGSPGAHGYGFKTGSLRPLQQRADGGLLTGVAGPPRVQTTEQAAQSDAPAWRTRVPLAENDYYTYGERPEHDFFSGNVTPKQPEFVHLPSTPQGPTTQSGGGDGGAGGLAGAGALLSGASSIAGALGYDNVLTQGAGAIGKGLTGNFPGAAKDAYKAYQGLTGAGASGATAGIGAAGLGAASGASALGAAAPIATDAALSNLGSITAGQLFGTSGSVAAGSGAGSLGTTGGLSSIGGGGGAAGATGAGASGVGATLAASGALQAIPLAAIAFAAADAFNKSGDIKSGATSAMIQALQDKGLITMATGTGRVPTFKLPDGRLLRADARARAASEAMRKGDMQAFEEAYNDWINHAYTPGGERAFKDWAQGKAHGGVFRTEGALRHVRGAGSGRSDSIPAQLSDGEYVLTAEDVSLLGDGSNEAGAKRLDGFRSELRKHKGGALARGKISPDAKAPMEYLRGSR